MSINNQFIFSCFFLFLSIFISSAKAGSFRYVPENSENYTIYFDAEFEKYLDVKKDKKVISSVSELKNLISSSKKHNTDVSVFFSKNDYSNIRANKYIDRTRRFFSSVESIDYKSVLFVDNYILINLTYKRDGRTFPWVEYFECVGQDCKFSNYPLSSVLRIFNNALQKSEKLNNPVKKNTPFIFNVGVDGVSILSNDNNLIVYIDTIERFSLCIKCSKKEKTRLGGDILNFNDAIENFFTELEKNTINLSDSDYTHSFTVKNNKEIKPHKVLAKSYVTRLLKLRGKSQCVKLLSANFLNNYLCRWEMDNKVTIFQETFDGKIVFPMKDVGVLNSLLRSKSLTSYFYNNLK